MPNIKRVISRYLHFRARVTFWICYPTRYLCISHGKNEYFFPHGISQPSRWKGCIAGSALCFLIYRVVKQNCQVLRFHDFEHIRVRMAQLFCKSSRHISTNSKQEIEIKGQDLSRILKKAKEV